MKLSFRQLRQEIHWLYMQEHVFETYRLYSRI